VLCKRHADAMVVPLGWMLDDRRTQVPQLFRTNVAAVAADRPRRSRPPTTALTDVTQLSLDAVADGDDATNGVAATSAVALEAPTLLDVPGDEASESVTATEKDDTGQAPASIEPSDPDLTKALPWRPTFDQSDDLDGLLSAQSPLLRRAFGRDRPGKS
jgi:hypothetical protein